MIKRIFLFIFLVIVLAVCSISAWLYSQVDGSLPILNGKRTVYGLTDNAIIDRDANGIITIKANNRQDVAVALGFVHAQERFFQMDLLRRNAAGELSSLFGNVALNYDKSIRIHRFRDRARHILSQLPKAQAQILKAYARGVNQGLAQLYAVPFEYLLLRQEPVEWQEEDSILTIFSMYLDLQQKDGKRERTLTALNSILTAEAFAFFNPKGSRWDAAIDGSQYLPSAMPTTWFKQAIKLARVSKNKEPLVNELAWLTNNQAYESQLGSNNWAVSGQLTQTGSAILENDMHLGIRVPNTWFRARLQYPSTNNHKVDVVGVTLPGTPNMVVGSNQHIAWGFTNSYGDYSDVITLTTDKDQQHYLTSHGYQAFSYHKQVIAIKDKKPEQIIIKETQWGPVIGQNAQGQLLAYRWVAHDINAVNLNLLQLETAKSVDDAIAIAATAGIPAQNLMVADSQGHIGWSIMGPLPSKKGKVGELAQDWSDGSNGWLGYLAPEQYPKVINPKTQRLWTANARVVGGEMLKKIGNGGYSIGARAQQIRDNLLAKQQFNEYDLLAIALDHQAKFLTPWRDFILNKVLTDELVTSNPLFLEAKQQLLKQPILSADKHSVAYRIVSQYRLALRKQVFAQLDQLVQQQDQKASLYSIRHQLEVPLWQLVNTQPEHFPLLGQQTWPKLLTNTMLLTLNKMTKHQSLAEATWGQLNQTQIHHPLASAVPFLAKWLNMPEQAQHGDSYMPMVTGRGFGASERMIVSPGHEESGILHMPTSQSGHPWSPYFGKGHQDWLDGKPSPLLPGKTRYTLTLLSY